MKKITAANLYVLVFGLFLGLCIWKFGNPVILDHMLKRPETWPDFWNDPWPIHWVNWILTVLVFIGFVFFLQLRNRALPVRWLVLLPLIWLGWQFIAATKTVDAVLTKPALWHFSGCVACYFIGVFVIGPLSERQSENLGRHNSQHPSSTPQAIIGLLLAGVMLAYTFCLVRASNQRLFEYPANRQMLVEGEQNGWTNFPPATVAEMKLEKIIIHTNDVDVANPVILKKFSQGRVAGTMVYPNALAGLILLLFPVSIAITEWLTRKMKRPIRTAAITLAGSVGLSVFFWTGSKLGWLIGVLVSGLCLLQLNWSRKLKAAAVGLILIVGLGVFTIRFHNYFASGATSVGARFDYWRAAVQTTLSNPLFGTGPGTFQRPYEKMKDPSSEMARLVHNDYLEQYSDSGLLGGLSYLAWVALALARVIKSELKSGNTVNFAVCVGLTAWFIQGLGEFGLYIPALAWLAFTLLGCLISRQSIEFDKKRL